ncbi:MAG: CoA transferase [Nevskia sp.]|nr:CoA transferase [Nevskia sp.]
MTVKLLTGVRVLDLSRTVAGPAAGQMLADFGAEVIRVERPGTGDDLRQLGPTHLKDREGRRTNEGAMFLAVNRNKKGITADLGNPAAQDLVRRLAAKCDVLIENYKVGDMKKFGLDYPAVSAVHPGIIYCSVTGYGQTGPYAARGGYDPSFQAMAGWMSVNGPSDDNPMLAGANPADIMSGYNAALGILAALYSRDRNHGRGQHIDVALLDVAVAAFSQRIQDYFVTGQQPPRRDLLGVRYPCADGALIVNTANLGQWQGFCKVLGLPDVAADERYREYPGRVAHRATLYPMLQEHTRTWPRDKLFQALEAAGVPAAPIYDIAGMLQDPQVRHRGLRIEVEHPLSGSVSLVANPIKFSDAAREADRAPPLLGQHTDEVLRGLLGLTDQEIGTLRRQGAI